MTRMNKHKALAFDFDGVIVDSMAYKTDTFRLLFADFSKHIEAIDTYNKREGGINRRVKFEYVYKNILHKPYSDKIEEKLTQKYGAMLKQKILDLQLVPGVKEFLRTNHLPAFVVSSSEKQEVELQLKHHDIKQYITGIYAHPNPKAVSLEKIASELRLNPKQIVFFGDAYADYVAAQTAGTQFVARSDDTRLFPAGTKRISNFNGFSL